MIGFLLTAAAILACGLGVSDRLWRRFGGDDDLRGAERIASGAIVGLSIWLAASWLLAVTHLFTRPALIAVAVGMGIASLVWRGLSSPRPRPERGLERPRHTVALLLPLIAWTLFALWKGFVLPPESHDALAYHFPKAALITQAHGFEHFTAFDPRITNLPANYELLVAGIFTMSGSDTLTEWIGTLSFLLFLCATAALAERWWGEQAHRAATALAVASAPVVLLHASADKNDLMTCALVVAGALWAARWSASGGRMPMLLAILSFAMAGGTKPNAAAVLAGVAPFLLLRWRTLRPREVALTAVAGILAFALLGGIAYADIARHSGGPVGVKVGHVEAGGGTVVPWGDFANLWQVPYLMLTVPFIHKANAVWVPWRGEYWYWPHYEIFFSHYGSLITILTLAAPFCALGVRGRSRERLVTTSAVAIAAAIMLPTHMAPVGMFAAMPRYLAFVLPVIACWSVPPLIESLRARFALVAQTLVAAIVIFFVASAVDCAVNDRFTPLRFVMWAAEHPGTRAIYFQPNRAASVVDRAAGPDDTIAIAGMFDSWSYPAFGAHITRHVIFLPESATPADIPPQAQWVIFDRAWNRLWQNPNLTDMGKMWTLGGKGSPSRDDLRLMMALRSDPRFALVFYDPRMIQAVFRRVR